MFVPGQIGCFLCLEHPQRCTCRSCTHVLTMVMPDTLTGTQCAEIKAWVRASFDVHVAEFVRRNQAKAVTR